jgi:acyl-CoA synthetase (AMP-forming)/AMP-acid ligase II
VHLTDLLEQASRGRGTVRFLSRDGSTAHLSSVSQLWSTADTAGDWLVRTVGRGGVIAALLTTSPACLAAIMGAWKKGLALVSLPPPARAMPVSEYAAQLEAMCALVGARHVLVDAEYVGLIPSPSLILHPFEACLAGGPPVRCEEAGELVQFTSGSAGRPKGVHLTSEAIAHNVLAILEVLAPEPEEVVCSWLPLSHDMGFIGVLLCSLAACAPEFCGSMHIVLIKPEYFMANPTVWLRACSRYRATLSAVPNFCLDVAVRTIERAGVLDLRSFRVIYVGSERVRADTLRGFQAATAEAGLRALALCPAYGMAEATLAVSCVRPDELWHSVHVDQEKLAAGSWTPAGPGGTELVSNGRPLSGVRCRVAAAGQTPIGELEISGPSLLSKYTGDQGRWADGWFRTGDLGYVDTEGQVFVIGRNDDVIVSHGRNLYGPEIIMAAETVPGVRSGRCVAVPTDDGAYAIVAELQARARAELISRAGEIRAVLARRFGAAPSAVLFVARGSLPKTSSGKPQPRRTRAMLEAGELSVESRVYFGKRKQDQ